MKNIEEIKNQTYALIDDLKKTTTENGLCLLYTSDAADD